MPSLLGQELGNYRLVKVLGKGGEGAVFLGQHQHLNFQAAIKVLIGARITTADDLADLRKEAQYLVTLKHPNIVTLYDFGIHQGIPYLVMEYALQGTLRTKHPKGTTVGFDSIVSYVQQIATALQFAHDNNIIHRDLKPDNLLVFNNTEIKLSDFGIAVITRNTRSYTTQDIIGTWPYMSPEQFRGKPHKASDQYALGIIVYEWLSGKLPFIANDFYGYADQHANYPVPVLPSTISPRIFEVLCKALAKTPEERFGNVKEFAQALRAINEREEEQKRLYELQQRQTDAAERQFWQQLRGTVPAFLDAVIEVDIESVEEEEKKEKQRRLVGILGLLVGIGITFPLLPSLVLLLTIGLTLLGIVPWLALAKFKFSKICQTRTGAFLVMFVSGALFELGYIVIDVASHDVLLALGMMFASIVFCLVLIDRMLKASRLLLGVSLVVLLTIVYLYVCTFVRGVVGRGHHVVSRRE